MLTRRSLGTVGAAVAVAVAVAAAFALAPAGPPPGQPAAAAGPDWSAALAGLAPEGFERPSGPLDLRWPRDHGAHPSARSEAWQVAAHLTDAEGTALGAHFSLFRLGLLPPGASTDTAWQARDLYRGHLVLRDGAGAAEERVGRGLPGLVGYDDGARAMRLDGWTLAFGQPDPEGWHLRATAGGIRADLVLAPLKAPVVVDAEEAPFRGYLLSRMEVTGTIEGPAGRQAVTGTAWAEHLWGELPIPGQSPVVSDRLQLQLDDGSDLSVVRTRRRDGGGTPTVDAVLVGPDGAAEPLGRELAEVGISREWQGATADWPLEWTLRLDDLTLSVTPVTDAQELAFLAPAWIGLVRAEGERGGRRVSGIGTLQLTGDDRP